MSMTGDIRKLNDKVDAKIDEMMKRICDLEDDLIRFGGTITKTGCNDEVVAMVMDHINDGYHPLTHDTDLILMRDLVMVMDAVYPEEDFFSMYNRDHTKIAKRLGALLANANVLHKKKASYYIPVDPVLGTKHSNSSRNIWILRKVKKYKKLGPASLDREYEQQWGNACRVYADKTAKAEALEAQPSFM